MKEVMFFVKALLVLMLLAFMGWAWTYFTAPIAGKVEAERTINSGANRVQAYNHYFDLCAAVQGYEATIDAQQSLANKSKDEATQNRANTIVAAITAQRARTIAQYNADAVKEYTTARFLGAELPKRLEVKQQATQCN